MAGGGGTRLWPLSRDKYPKQFTQLYGNKTLIQRSFDRALRAVKRPENIIVTTRAAFVPEIQKQLKRLPRENILVENVKRDTAPSIAMAAALLSSRGKHDESMLLMPSDPYFRNEDLYVKSLVFANDYIGKNAEATVLLGSKPTYPETGYGYIELDQNKYFPASAELFGVKSFREKPDLEKAKQFLASGNFAWNMGVYCWRVGTLLELLHKFAPEIAKLTDEIEELFRLKKIKKIPEIYTKMPSISIDFAVTEHQDPKNIYVIRGEYGWSDIGHFGALQELVGGKEGLELKKGVAAVVNASNNFIYNTADKAIGLAGVNNLIVISTPDALLVCDKDHVQDVKKLVEQLGKDKKGKKFI